MEQVCKFNKAKDIQEFQRGLSPDIDLAIHSGVIPDTTAETSYNGLEGDDIGRRIGENFDVIEYDRAFSRIKAKIEAKKSKKD